MNKLTLFVCFWIFFLVVTTGLWIHKNNLPPAWDQANYLTATETMYQSLVAGNYIDFLEKTTTSISRRAPLLTYLPLPLFLLFGSSPKTALIINLIFLVLFSVFYYLFVKKIFNEKIAFIALLITTTTPIFYGLQRQFYVEYGLTALIITWLYFLIKTDQFKNKKYCLLLGLVSGLGMLMKFHFFIFVGGAFLYYLYKSYGFKTLEWKNFKKLLYIFIPAGILMFPWYSKNILTLLWHAKRATNPEILGIYYYGNPFSIDVIFRTLLDIINYVISPYYLLAIILLSILAVIKKDKIIISFLLLFTFLPPFLIFFFGPNKDYRFMISLIPFVTLFIAIVYNKAFKEWSLRLIPLFILFPILIYIHTTVVDIGLNNIKMGSLIIADKNIGRFVSQSNNSNWPNEQILSYLATLPPNDKIKNIILASENEELNINNLIHYQTKHNLPLKIKTASYYPKITDFRKDLPDLFNADKNGEVILIKKDQDYFDFVTYYLQNQQERIKIAERGFKRTIRDHSYIKRLTYILDFLKK